MNSTDRPPLKSPAELTDLYFLDARSKLLDIAAFLDRVERAGGTHDYRVEALREALARTACDGPGDTTRAKDIQLIFSDPTAEPLESAAGMKGATGAWPGKAAR